MLGRSQQRRCTEDKPDDKMLFPLRELVTLPLRGPNTTKCGARTRTGNRRKQESTPQLPAYRTKTPMVTMTPYLAYALSDDLSTLEASCSTVG